MAAPALYPLASRDVLLERFIGKTLQQVPLPAAVIDLSTVKKNSSRMLDACKALDLSWRAHIKTHKTTELTRLQVGDHGPVKLIVSTVLEAEHIIPLLLEYKAQGRSVNLLYAFPVAPSTSTRLAAVAKSLGSHGFSLMVDHPDQLVSVDEIWKASGIAPDVFLKIDMGYKRAGVPLGTEAFSDLSTAVLEHSSAGHCHFLGLYAHAGHSYQGGTAGEAMDLLNAEFQALLTAARTLQSSLSHGLVLSVGATPTTTSIWNFLSIGAEGADPSAAALLSTMSSIRGLGCVVEVHAGVYCVLDLQQLSTHAQPRDGSHQVSLDDIALTIIAEVASIYPGRGANSTDEALISAGTLALGREPCKAYPGWGILTPWNRPGAVVPKSVEKCKGWIVGGISQEHGILRQYQLSGVDDRDEETLTIGQKVRIWPNHACVSGAGFGWYFVVDGSDTIVDIWVRWRGW